jgi:DNA-binding LacI/PurR family transcriptional regulator
VADHDDRARAATIFDVARLAGVSHQTVSRVLNDLPNVRPATRARVEQAIKQLRYVPSPAARALVTRRTRTLGLIVTGAPDYGPSSTALHFNEAARDARYSVITASMLETDAPSLRSAAELLVRQNVEAIVLIAAERAALDALDGVELGVPIIAVASEDRGGMHRVWLDQYSGARLAVEHLISLGHREIRHVSGPSNAMDAAERVRGWSAALGEHGLPAREPLVGDWSPRSGAAHGRTLAADADMTAVFVSNDQMALGVMHALAEAGHSVPGDVSVVGFDDIFAAELCTPGLTTVSGAHANVGWAAMEILLEALAPRRPDASPARVTLPTQLVLRQSTSAAAALTNSRIRFQN